MANIKILDQALINKIAAGEVIESPASVVKELIENSIDAGATTITVEIEQAGKKGIKVTDNGCGMPKQDALLSIERHSTSKISNLDDLFSISTLGFRGEALASIAAVSLLRLTTKTNSSLEGVQIETDSGKVIAQKEVAATTGTIVEVNDLFYNTPARKKYLKSDASEVRKIIDIMTRYALINNQIFFKLISDKKVIINSPDSDEKGKIISLYGKEFIKDILEVDYNHNNIKIKGFISKPSLTRSSKDSQSIYVNNRYIKNNIISNALHDAYHTLLMIQRYPVAILKIALDPSQVDVNVHPTKKEIRLANESLMYESVFNAVRETLVKNDLIQDIKEAGETEIRFIRPLQAIDAKKAIRPKQIAESRQEMLAAESKVNSVASEADQESSLFALGQVHKCYIIAERRDGFMIIDQHAANERILYEMLMKRYNSTGIGTQKLIQSTMLELNPKDTAVLANYINDLKQFGFDIEHFGGNSFAVRSVPVIIGKQQSRELIIDIIDALSIKKLEEIKEKIIIMIACKAAIKSGDALTIPQINKLIKELFECELPYTCPHGRPVIINMGLKDLEKRFKRIV